MAMGWLKGLVAPAAFPDGAQQGVPLQQQQQGGPPVGGAPSPYGMAPAPGPQVAPAGPAPYDTSSLNSPMQWSTGTKTQGSTPGGISGGAGPAAGGAPGGGALEARCAQLQHDVDSLALFARTLLTMLEESKIVTREHFDATKQRLDLLDGKLDDR